MRNVFITLLIIFGLFQSGFSQEDASKGLVGTNTVFSAKMLDPVADLRKVNIFLEQKQEGTIPSNGLILGASIISIFDYQKSSVDSKFGYLMRHPTSGNQVGPSVSEFVLHSAQFSIAGNVNNWLSFYTELLYNPEQSFGQGTLTALGRNLVQLRKGFVVIGDLKKHPVYAAIGKMDAPFGSTGSVNPFTNSTLWHAFAGLGFGAQVAYKKDGFYATLMAIQGGSQFRVLSTPVDKTNVPSKVNNFSADVNYSFSLAEKGAVKLGASYLHGTSYTQEFPVQHFNSGEENNPATAFYADLTMDDFLLKLSYVTTMKVWPGTHNPNPPLDVFEASKVSSLSIGAKYLFPVKGDLQYALSGEFSNFISGPDNAPWKGQDQIVLGFSATVKNASRLFVELFKTKGYSPLNWISGGNLPDLGTTHSERDAKSFGIVAGAMITI